MVRRLLSFETSSTFAPLDAIHNFHPQYRDYTQYSAPVSEERRSSFDGGEKCLQNNAERSPASNYGLNQYSTSALSSSASPTPADGSYHDGGSPATPGGYPVQAPPPSSGASNLLQQLPNKILPKALLKKDGEKDMLLINDDI